MSRRARRVLAGLGALATVLVGAAVWLALASLPRHSGELELPGLSAPVEILRDEHAVPFIRAGDEADAWAALGFVHGQDRLWQLELTRRIGQGRLAELVGAEALPLDRFARTLGFARVAREGLGAYRPEERALLDAYARGVNAAIAAARPLPPEFQLLWHEPEPWRAEDSLLVHRLLAWELAVAWRRELARARLVQRLDPQELELLLPRGTAAASAARDGLDPPPGRLLRALADLWPETTSGGSNVFVLAGQRTTSGAPLLASDPHLPLRTPGIWYLAWLRAPGIEVGGGTIPGLPAVVIGRTATAAWGLTTTGADTEDLVRLRVDPSDPDRYLVPGGTEPFERIVEEIRVRFARPERLVVRRTRFGPVISDLVPEAAAVLGPGEVLALRWTGLDPTDRTLATGFALARAGSLEEVVRAFEDFASPVQNVAVADRAGRIGLAVRGRIPLRRTGDGRLPAEARTGAAEWSGWIPTARLPAWFDPPEGFLLNANEPLAGPAGAPPLPAEWEGPERARRLRTLLEGRAAMDAAAARAIQQDLVSAVARELLPVLVPLARAGLAPGSPLTPLLDALAGFDGIASPERFEPTLLAAWLVALGQEVGPPGAGALLADLAARRPEAARRLLVERPGWCGGPEGEAACPGRVAAAFARAVAALEAQLGPDPQRWSWGAQHPAVMPHRPFGELPVLGRLMSISVPVGGDATTLAVAAWRALGPGGPFPAHHAAGLRLVADLAEPGLRAITATGQVGHPLSRHRRDLTAIWAGGGELRLDPAAIETGAARRLRLRPTQR